MNSNFIQSIKNKGGFKTQSNNGGGRQNVAIGLWEDPQGRQKHIKTKALGIGDGQGFIIDIVKDKIRLITFSNSEVDELKKNGINVFKSCSKGLNSDGSKKYQSYAVIEGIDNDMWRKMVEINGGVKRYNKNSVEGQKVLAHYEVIAYKAQEKATAQAQA
nr:MAG TPA: hypothetical protein [Caudoviricetes sp.]